MIKEPEQPKVYTAVYSDFKGIDVTSEKNEVYKRRSPDSINMIPDLDGTPHKRGGFNLDLENTYEGLRGIDIKGFPYIYNNKKTYMFIEMYNSDGETVEQPIIKTETGYDYGYEISHNQGYLSYFPSLETTIFYNDEVYRFGDVLYRLNNKYYEEVTPKTPLITIGRRPTGGGTPYEAVNLLTDEVRETFLGDSTSKDYYTSFPIDKIKMVSYKNSSGNYVSTTAYTLSADNTHITFTSPHAPVVTGEDNISIRYVKETSTNVSLMRKTFTDAYHVEPFGTGGDTRLLVTGAYYTWTTRAISDTVTMPKTTYCNRVWYSEPNDITYFPDTNYFIVPNMDIVGMKGANEYLYIFERGGNVHMFYPTTFDKNATFAIKKTISTNIEIQSNTLKVFNQEPIFYSSENGICTVETNNTDVIVRTKSYYINKEIIGKDITSATVWGNYYIITTGNTLYLLDGTQKSSWVNEKTDFQYECYKWAIPENTIAFSVNDKLFLYHKDNRCIDIYDKEATTDNGTQITCTWTTVLDDDGLANYFKNMKKKNCVVTLAPAEETNVKVYVKVDNADFELIYSGAFTGDNRDITVPIDIYLNKKFKKYKRLQFKIVSDSLTGTFGIQQIIKMYTICGFSKGR